MMIQTNILSLNVYRNLKNLDFEHAIAASRLANGQRINTAADDAAGLAISERMIAQIRGLDMAAINIQNGINLVTVAEGAAQSITDILQRKRELSIQAANDTNTAEARQKIQLEIAHLTAEIDGIANRAQFNKIPVAAPRIVQPLSPPTAIYSEVTTSGMVDVVFVIDATSTMMGGMLQNVIDNLNAFVSSMDPDAEVRFGLVAFGLGGGAAGSPVRKLDFARLNETGPQPAHSAFAGTGMLNPNVGREWTSDAAEFERALRHLQGSAFGGFNRGENGLEALLDSNFGAMSFERSANRESQFILITDQNLVHSDGRGTTMTNPSIPGTAPGNSAGSFSLSGAAQALNNAGISLTVVYNGNSGAVGGTTGGLTYGGGPYTLWNLAGYSNNFYDQFGNRINSPIDGTSANFSESLSALARGITIGSSARIAFDRIYEPIEILQPLWLQTGANANQGMLIRIDDLRAHTLGVHEITVVTVEDAIEATRTIDGALASLNRTRSRYGSYINRLQAALRSVNISNEKLSASNSRIRDADMAEHTMELLKNSLLRQVGVSLLAQTNHRPNDVLELLRGA